MSRYLLSFAAILIVIVISFSAVTSHADTLGHTLGVGVGIPYGGMGVNYELAINDYIAPTAGLGYFDNNAIWNAGVRFYYPGRDYKFRGRLTALYGVNTILEDKQPNKNTEYDTRTGFSGGIGFDARFGTHWSFNMDILAAERNIPDNYESESNSILMALGFSYRF